MFHAILCSLYDIHVFGRESSYNNNNKRLKCTFDYKITLCLPSDHNLWPNT